MDNAVPVPFGVMLMLLVMVLCGVFIVGMVLMMAIVTLIAWISDTKDWIEARRRGDIPVWETGWAGFIGMFHPGIKDAVLAWWNARTEPREYSPCHPPADDEDDTIICTFIFFPFVLTFMLIGSVMSMVTYIIIESYFQIKERLVRS